MRVHAAMITMHQSLADAVLLLHFGVVIFVVGGLLAIVAGNLAQWGWVNQPSFRWAHLGAIGFVVLQSWLGATCPLTVLENRLRVQAGGSTYATSFIEYWVSRLMYYAAPAWVFASVYTLFSVAVLAAWWYWPPRPGTHRFSSLKFLWASPCTAVGLVLAAVPLALGGRARWSSGALEVTWRDRLASCGELASRLPVRGIVFGHVILAVTDEDLGTIGPHERVHVAQYERWGPLFLLLYAASSLWQLINGRNPYWHNHFEVQARLKSR